jgi:hypothetical protein
VELKYDITEPTGYLASAAGDTVCVWFDAVPGGRLDSIRVALRRAGTMTGGVWTFTGTVRPSPLGTPLAVPIYATVNATPTYSGDPLHPYPVPWPSSNWAAIDLRSRSISTANPFAVAFVCAGDATTEPRVMITESSIPANPTSLSYDGQNSSPNWYYFVSNDAGDSVYTYLIRAYIGFDTSSAPSDTGLVPAQYELEQNYPNPFNAGTTIRFVLPQDSKVTLKVYDVLGREVATLVDGTLPASTTPYSIAFNASGLSSGVYFYELVADNFSATKKLVMVR